MWQFPENNNEFIKLQQLKTQDHIKWVISNSSLKTYNIIIKMVISLKYHKYLT